MRKNTKKKDFTGKILTGKLYTINHKSKIRHNQKIIYKDL